MSLAVNDFYCFDDFELQPSRRIILRSGERVAVAPKTFEVLFCLVQNAGHVVLKEQLLKAVWPESFVEESNLTQHIFWLRKALADKAGYIETIPGRGYEFTGKVTVVPHPEPAVERQVAEAADLSFRIQHETEVMHIVVEETTTFAPPRTATTHWKVSATVAGIAVLLFAAGWGTWKLAHRASVVPGDHHAIVIADFENTTGDATFDHSLKTLLSIDLNQSTLLAVSADTETHEVLKLMARRDDEPLRDGTAIEVCQRLSDQAVLTGLIAPFGKRYLVTLTATDCANGKPLVQQKAVAASRDDVLSAVDKLATQMRSRLGETLKQQPAQGTALPLVHTASLEALRAYSQADAFASAGNDLQALPLYQRAVELDPNFTTARFGLVRSYARLAEYDKSNEELFKAYQLRDQTDEATRFRITIAYDTTISGDLQDRLRMLKAWTQMYPNQVRAWIDLSHMETFLDHPELGIEPGLRAIAVAPNNVSAYEVTCEAYLESGKLTQARDTCSKTVAHHIDNDEIHSDLYAIDFLLHDEAGMQVQADTYKGTSLEGLMPMHVLFYEGRAREAVAMWQEYLARQRRSGLQERVDRVSRTLLRREADLELNTQIRQQIATMDPNKYPQNMVIANAEIGNVAEAERQLKVLFAQPYMNTISVKYDNQQAVAAVFLAKHQPEKAIAALEEARPYDYSSLEGPSMRARAYLAAGQGANAEAEFQKVLDHPYIAITLEVHPMAQLGIARAYRMEGKIAQSRAAYEGLFEAWKHADADMPLLVQARAEYAKLK